MATDLRVICFYLPQYHPIPENDAAWGVGYTEWRHVVMAQPLFEGHYQPRLPADLGFYDLRVPEIRVEQAELARRYGIFGFCYYFYWLGNGRRLLERPLDEMIGSGQPDFPFCVCWANHHWRKNWIGSQEAVVRQSYSEDDTREMIRELIPMFRDKRYILVDGKPLFVVYKSQSLPDPSRYADIWRQEVQAAGFPDLYICRIENEVAVDPVTIGFDAAIEFPPSGVRSATRDVVPLESGSGFKGVVCDYEQTAFYASNRPSPSFKLFRGVVPSWDNTSRRSPGEATIFHGASPETYQDWLAACVEWTKVRHEGDERMIFVNAWNEWGESAYLEPDLRFGHAYLEATLNAVANGTRPANSSGIKCATTYRLEKKDLFDLKGNKLTLSKNIKGSIEMIEHNDGKLQLAGWALDADNPELPLHILLFHSEKLLVAERTFVQRPDVAAQVERRAKNCGFFIEADLVASDAVNVVAVAGDARFAVLK